MKQMSTSEFINKAQMQHNSTYNYEKVEYTSSNNPVTIVCPIHGDFSQKPSIHLRGSGCRKCSREKSTTSLKKTQKSNATRKRKSLEDFISKANTVHKSLYNYSLVCYQNTHTNVSIICPTHGKFEQRPTKHLAGSGCPLCARIKCGKVALVRASNSFVDKARMVHGDEYIYSKVSYVSAHDKVDIVCNIHGTFSQTPNSHLNGSGCPSCSNVGVYNNTTFTNKPHLANTKGHLYLFGIMTEYGPLIKIGITIRNVNERLNEVQRHYPESDLIWSIPTNISKAFEIEQEICSTFSANNTIPDKIFAGRTECFQLSTKQIEKLIESVNYQLKTL